ncbi:RloB domain-containing protein [Chryseobacterium sp. POL2]|uniref:RloB family protein n=1 Tax=Chryseobacterium sp. POL2 TaxID=2713414 RepID=UPI0013E1960A|nr:RloB family protein [Chryseobacterium sp. POL2]QIG88623.1 RloB domain-containing protein [Chryseobacterium sp. POL2]
MPREREDFFRESNTTEREKIFVLAFEGNKTEEKYFSEFRDSNKFNDELIYLHLLKRANDDTNSAPNHVFSKLKKEAKDEFNFKTGDELWMIIDTDRWRNIPDIIQACNDLENMFVAVSNPCFEFWLLLHIKDIQEYGAEELELIFRNRKTGNRNYVDTKIVKIVGSYNKTNLKVDDFLPNIDLAISRAKNLDQPQEEYPTKLGSHIYKLIEKIKRD